MDVNQRFDQLESLLVDLARKQDQQAEQIKQLITAVSRQEQRLDRIDQRLDGIDQRLDGIGEQIDAIINIFKISEARHTQAEERQEAMLTEIREQGRALNAQGVAIKEQGRRLDDALNVQLQMLQLMRAGNDKADDLAQRLAPLENQEPRLKRLEDEVFRAAS